VELDGIEGYARYWLREPKTLSFEDMLEAAADAAYTITKVELELQGNTSRADCEHCAGEVSLLTIPETGQRFELAGEVPAGQSLRGIFDVSNWEGEHPQITLQTPLDR